MAARVDRLPVSGMAWELALLVQVGWACAPSADGISARLYPFIWLPRHVMTSFEYSVLYALETGISILIGGYVIGWLADRIGRRKALILSSVLAGVFIWPFGYVTSYPALVVLSLADTLGFAGYLAVNVVYMSEIMGPAVRSKVIMRAQVLAIFLLAVVLASLIPHYWIPGRYRRYLWLLAGLNIAVALVLSWRVPESPRWLDARQRRDQARAIVERMEARVTKHHPDLPEPDLTPHQAVAEEKTRWFAPFSRGYLAVATVGTTLGQFSMWVYIPGNYPTRMRSLGTGWTDGVGHLGAWGGVLLSGVVFTAAAPRGWIVLITIPGALLPACMVAIFGKRQRRRTLEELAR